MKRDPSALKSSPPSPRTASVCCGATPALADDTQGYVVPNPRWADARDMLGFARLVTHYFSNAAWLDDGVSPQCGTRVFRGMLAR